MLLKQGLLPKEDSRKIAAALLTTELRQLISGSYSGQFEDL
ncbi:hypothetical protein [Candidatus Pristimantibacillus sp. PTI5]